MARKAPAPRFAGDVVRYHLLAPDVKCPACPAQRSYSPTGKEEVASSARRLAPGGNYALMMASVSRQQAVHVASVPLRSCLARPDPFSV
jgi:hypothetical protein